LSSVIVLSGAVKPFDTRYQRQFVDTSLSLVFHSPGLVAVIVREAHERIMRVNYPLYPSEDSLNNLRAEDAEQDAKLRFMLRRVTFSPELSAADMLRYQSTHAMPDWDIAQSVQQISNEPI
jgi:hypothetical protein